MPADTRAIVRASPDAIDPDWLSSGGSVLPYCSGECRSHDGKRCRLLGHRPGDVCEPAVSALIRHIEEAPNAR